MGDGRLRGAGRVDGVDVHGLVAMVAGCRYVVTMVAGCRGLRAEDAPAEVAARRRWRWHRWCDDDGDDDHGDDAGGAVDGDGDEMVVMVVGGGGVGDGGGERGTEVLPPDHLQRTRKNQKEISTSILYI